MKKDLPIIMYDQEMEGNQWIWQIDRIFNNVIAEKMQKLSGYVPENWVLYTNRRNDISLFFGAYPQETLDRESKVGYESLKDEGFKESFSKMLDMAKNLSQTYFRNFYEKEKGSILQNPESVAKYIKEAGEFIGHVYTYHILIQPQRFYKIEKELEKEDDSNLNLLFNDFRKS